MDTETLELKFHRDTLRALAALEADRRHLLRRWYLFSGYIGLLFQVVGLAVWLVSPQAAAALAVTSTLYSVYSGFVLTIRARRYGRLPNLHTLDETVRFHAAMAWHRLGLVFRLRTMAFANLCAGMSFYALWQYAEGIPVSSSLLDWVVIACAFLQLLLLPIFHVPRVLKPLMDRLGAPNTP